MTKQFAHRPLAGGTGAENDVSEKLDSFSEELLEQVKFNDGVIAQRRALSGRSCNACSMCCKVLPINQPELKKPAGKWCPQCRVGQGCAIYDTRPLICRSWACEWLTNPSWPEYWRPNKSKLIVHVPQDDGPFLKKLLISVDESSPNRWRKEPYYSDIKQASHRGLCGVEHQHWYVVVQVGSRGFLILPNKDVELPEGTYEFGIVRTGEAEWDVNFAGASERGQL